jgi:hypothetical protein
VEEEDRETLAVVGEGEPDAGRAGDRLTSRGVGRS